MTTNTRNSPEAINILERILTTTGDIVQALLGIPIPSDNNLKRRIDVIFSESPRDEIEISR